MNNTATFSIPLSLRTSGSALKVIAILSMVADHCAYFLMEPDAPFYGVLRSFGRIAFPVFAFLVAEGFAHSRNRMKYFLILIFAGMVSEIPWYLLNGADDTHNVMFTLALGVAALAMFDRLCEHGPLSFVGVIAIAALAWWLGTDYDWRGVLMIFLFYILRHCTMRPWLERSSTHLPSQAVLQILFTFPLMAHYGIAGAMLASALIFLYDGTRGFIRGNAAKYVFYAVYPAHLLLIAAYLYFLQIIP